MLHLFNNGASSSSLNCARSALSFFLCYDFKVKDNETIARLFRFFYKERPLKTKYFTYWPVKNLLNYLAELHPASDLSLKILTLKTLALVALTSSDRGQTIHLMDIEKTTSAEDSLQFVIFDRLKTTGRVQKPKVITCHSCDIPSLNVCDYVLNYMNRTLALRAKSVNEGKSKPTQLFLSWATKKAVTRQTLARWLKTILKMAGIDTTQFTGHSFRGASLSNAYQHGANINQIVCAGSWTNTETFKRHYFAPENDTPVGRIILDHFSRG